MIPNGLYVDRFAAAEPREDWRGTDGTVAFVGRLGEHRKGFPVLARAFGRLARERPGLRLLVVGGGDVDEAKELLPGDVRSQVLFLGAATDAEKAAALRTADVYVAPNTASESFGIVLAEAMAAGATALASDLPAFERMLGGGEHGRLFPAGDCRRARRRPGRPDGRPGSTGRPRGQGAGRRTSLRLVERHGSDRPGLRDGRRGEPLMEPWLLLVAAALVAIGLALWLTWTANRLDRIHHRIDVACAALDGQLLRRSGAALELAASDSLDPPSRLLLLDAAHHARNAEPDEVEIAESVLSQSLRAVLGDEEAVRLLRDDPDLAPLVDELATSCARVELARRFHNDAVASALALRSRRRVRVLRLAGHAPQPRTVDLDDVPPAALAE